MREMCWVGGKVIVDIAKIPNTEFSITAAAVA